MKFLKSLFGASAEKHEDKADELRLDFEYRDAAYYYRKAVDALDPKDEGGVERLRRKLREVRYQALLQLLEEAAELVEKRAPELAHEKLEIAANFADEDAAKQEVARRQAELAEQFGAEEPVVEAVEEVTGTDADLFELALTGYEPEDRERALALGDPFRGAFEACQKEAWPEALAAVLSLLREHPEEPLLLELAGMCSENAGNGDEAVAFWQRAHVLAPRRPGVIQGLASHYRGQGRHGEARSLLASAVEARPVSEDLPEAWVPVYLEHALLLSEDGHHQHAVSAAAALLDVAAADPGLVFYNLAGILERAGREDDGRKALERSIELAPRRAIYRERLADFLVDRRTDLDMALSLLVSANEAETTGRAGALGTGGAMRSLRSPNRARYLYKMARVYFLKGEDLEAERTITTALAVSRDPEVTRALEALKKELKETGPRS